MDTKKLRQKILDLAIRGKLVPQDPNDEPASVLLERIRAEKERLISEGKIKRPKKSKATSSESHYQNFEPPFEIPDSWEWAQVNDITSSILYGVSESAKSQGEYKLLRITDIQDNSVNWGNVPYTDFDKNKAAQYILQNGDIVFARTGATVGKSYLVESVSSNTIYASYLIRIRTNEEILPEYLKIFFESTFYWQQIFEGAVGIGQPNVNGTSLGLLWLPIPPRNEQRRIVSNTQDFTLIVTSMEYSQKAINESITQIKSKLLEFAMQGKLVPQDPTDESAADMLKRINPKAKIITDNPHSRNIPDGWCLCELRDLCSFLSRGKSPKYSDVPNNYPVFAQKCNLKDGGISLNQARFLDESTLLKWPDRYKLKDLDILVNSTGTGTVGRTRLFLNKYLKDFPFVLPDAHVSVVRTFDEIDSKFIYYNLISREGQTYFNDNLSGSTNQKELYIEAIGNKLIFLPPKNEQERIVAKIEKFYHCIDNIEASLQS